MSGRVLHINSPEAKQALADGTGVYIGRAVPRRRLKGSKWANPFPISAELSRQGAVDKYRAWLSTQKELIAALPELYGKDLICWCAPEPCHGQVLLEWLEAIGYRYHIVLPLEDGSFASAQVSPDVDPKTREALTEMANAASRAIKRGEL